MISNTLKKRRSSNLNPYFIDIPRQLKRILRTKDRIYTGLKLPLLRTPAELEIPENERPDLYGIETRIFLWNDHKIISENERPDLYGIET